MTTRTIYRWLAAWRRDGFDGLAPSRRRDVGTHRVDPAILELAAALRREAPARSATHIAEVIARTRGVEVGPRMLQRFFAANGLDRARLEGRMRAYGRFEAACCGDRWTADAWDGPPVAELGGRHAQLFSVIDDHSRLVAHGAFYPDVSERSFQHCLRTGIARRGVPRRLYSTTCCFGGQLAAEHVEPPAVWTGCVADLDGEMSGRLNTEGKSHELGIVVGLRRRDNMVDDPQ